MRCLHDLYVRTGHGIAIAGDDQTFELGFVARPMGFNGLRHGGRGLARTDDNQPPFRGIGQVGRDAE